MVFYGFDYKKDESDGQWVKIPKFDILNLELWDFKRTITYGYNEEKHCMVRNRYGAPNQNRPVDDMMHISENVAKFIGTKDWLFESYRSTFFNNGESDVFPAIVTELQCGQIKNHEYDVLLVSHILPWSIRAVDHTRNKTREIVSRARKYGIASDGKLTYNERKAKSEEVGRALLKIVGLTKWTIFINALKAARKLDTPGKTPQVHDVFDSLLLGLYYCIEKYEELEKQVPMLQTNDVPEISRNIEITICDESDEDDRKLTKVPIENDKRSMISLTTLSDNLTAAFEKMDKKPKVTKKTTKRKRDFIDDDDLSEEAEKSVKKARKNVVKKTETVILKPKATAKPRKKAEPKEKKIPAAKKYKQLAFVTQ